MAKKRLLQIGISKNEAAELQFVAKGKSEDVFFKTEMEAKKFANDPLTVLAASDNRFYASLYANGLISYTVKPKGNFEDMRKRLVSEALAPQELANKLFEHDLNVILDPRFYDPINYIRLRDDFMDGCKLLDEAGLKIQLSNYGLDSNLQIINLPYELSFHITHKGRELLTTGSVEVD